MLSQCDVYQDYDVSTNITVGCPDGWFYSEEVYTIVNQVTVALMRKPLAERCMGYVMNEFEQV